MIITLIGSLQFEDEWHEASKVLTLAGHIVISVAVFPSTQGSKEWYSKAQKTVLDLVHLRKIALADATVLVHPSYIGQSTAREILYADQLGKMVFSGASAIGPRRTWGHLLQELERGIILPMPDLRPRAIAALEGE